MAKRFGRNQRRKLREALAQAQRDAMAASHEARVQHELGRSARNTLRYVEDALRRFDLTACLPAKTITIPGRPSELPGYRVVTQSAPLEYWGPNDDAVPGPESTFAHADLNLLTGEVERRNDRGESLVHVFLRGKPPFSGSWCYVASDAVFARGLPPDARQQIALALARVLLEMVDRDLRRAHG